MKHSNGIIMLWVEDFLVDGKMEGAKQDVSERKKKKLLQAAEYWSLNMQPELQLMC